MTDMEEKVLIVSYMLIPNSPVKEWFRFLETLLSIFMLDLLQEKSNMGGGISCNLEK